MCKPAAATPLSSVTLCNALSGRSAYSTDTRQTLNLLRELFSVVDRKPCEITLLDLEELFLHQLSAHGVGDNVVALAEIKQRVAEEYSSYLCDGAFEGLYYAEIWKRISLSDRVEQIVGPERGNFVL
jgi:hypothetical protein